MTSHQVKGVEIFCSYSHKDESLREELGAHLSALKREGKIEHWHDRLIRPGENWKNKIDEHLERAHIIMLLISADFIESNYCHEIEMERAMERHRARKARVIPIILRRCDWEHSPFGELQALPKGGEPVSGWPSNDDAFTDIAKGIRLVVDEMLRKPTGGTPPSDPTPAPSPEPFTPPAPPILREPVVGFVSRAGTIDGQSVDIVTYVKEKLDPHNNSWGWVTLWGKGGVGKTTLGKEIARQWKKEYGGRVVFSNAAKKVDYTRESLLKHIFEQLRGSEEQATRPQTEEAEAHALVAQSPTLILIDTYERVMPDARECIMEWLEEARCVALFTSHERVDHTTNITVPSMSVDEAHELIRRLFSNSSVPDKFNEDISRRVSEAARRRPILIEWLESQINIGGVPPEKLLREMKQGRGDAAERIFDHFFNLPQLGEDGRVALLALSLFVPGASREALAAVAGFPGDEVRLTNALEILHRLKLVAGDNKNERFALQSLTLVMTAARLTTSPYASDIWRRFTDYFNDPGLRNKQKSNVLRAIQTAACAHDWDSVVELYDATDEFMRDAFKSWVEAIRLAEEYAEQQIRIEGRPRPRLIEIQHRDKGAAREHYAGIEAKLGREEKPWRTVVRCAVKFELGVFACDCGDYALARELMQEAQALQKKINHNFGVAMTCNNLGVVIAKHRQAGWKVEAMSKFQQAFKYFTDRAEEDSAQVRDRYAQSLCNITGLGTDWKQGERFAKAVEMNLRWLNDLP